jgi:DNA-binding MarR family transcriptional regulator
MKYQALIHLISTYEKYEEESGETDLKKFGIWLAEQPMNEMDSEQEEKTVEIAKETYQNIKENTDYYKQPLLATQILILMLRMSRYVRNYVKHSDLPLNLEEVGFLLGVYHEKKTKTELINLNFMEITTGTEIIRRLLKIGFLMETENQTDKRSKYVSLTETGKMIVESNFDLLDKLATIAAGTLNHAQQQQLADLLEQLNDFHLNNYFEHREASVDEILRLNNLFLRSTTIF